jgi:hypothetical protein
MTHSAAGSRALIEHTLRLFAEQFGKIATSISGSSDAVLSLRMALVEKLAALDDAASAARTLQAVTLSLMNAAMMIVLVAFKEAAAATATAAVAVAVLIQLVLLALLLMLLWAVSVFQTMTLVLE